MKVHYDARLVEERVRAEMGRDPSFREIWARRLEPVYELPEEERAGALVTAYASLFAEHRLGHPLEDFLARWPLIKGLEEVLVFKALRRQEEGAELSRDHAKMGLRLLTDRLATPERLYPFLAHELMHISDMLDPSFAYREEPLAGAAGKGHLVSRRYGVLWDTYIDGRLARQGQGDESSREGRQRELELIFSSLPRRERVAAFSYLWGAEGLTHPELFQMASDPSRLSLLGASAPKAPLAPIPGTLCPLCCFPTYDWASPGEESLPLIRKDFPTWTPEEGLCQRCYEYYSLRAVESRKG